MLKITPPSGIIRLIHPLLCVAGGALLLFILWPSAPVAPIPTASSTGAAWRARVEAVERERAAVAGELRGLSGRYAQLKAYARGLELRKPDSVIHYDTIIAPPDVAILPGTSIDGSGRLNVLGATKTDSGYAPFRTPVDARDCDDGLTLLASGILCNKARLGHLTVFVRPSVSVAFMQPDSVPRIHVDGGLRWEPTYRNAQNIELYTNEKKRITLAGSLGFHFF